MELKPWIDEYILNISTSIKTYNEWIYLNLTKIPIFHLYHFVESYVLRLTFLSIRKEVWIYYNEKLILVGHQWLIPVILATWDADIGRTEI
jgi:hypothetical protein